MIPAVMVFLFIVILLPFQGDCKTLYRWTDHQGQVHITDYPPLEGQAVPGSLKSVDVKDGAPDERKAPAETKDFPLSDLKKLENIERDSAELIEGMKQQLDLTGLDQVSLTRYISMFRNHFSAMVILVVVTFLLFHFLYALPLYLISRKMALSYAWTSWIPVINIFPLVGSARLPLWLGIFFLLPVHLSIPVLGSSNVFLLVILLVSLVDMVLIVVIWMRICSNLWVNRWAGLLILLPILQLALPWYLALKTDPEHLVRSDIKRLRTGMIALGVFVALSVGIAASTHYYVKPALEHFLDKGLSIQTK